MSEDHPKDKKGFSGLTDLASDVSNGAGPEQSSPPSKPPQPESTKVVSNKTGREAPHSPGPIEAVKSGKSSRRSLRKWTFGIVGITAIIFVIWLITNKEQNTETPSSNSPPREIRSEPAIIQLLNKYVGQHPLKILNEQMIVQKLKALLGNKYDSFVNKLSVSDSLKVKGNYFVASGCAPHACGDEEVAFAFNRQSGDLHVIMLMNMTKLEGFGTTKDLPEPLDEWQESRRVSFSPPPSSSKSSTGIYGYVDDEGVYHFTKVKPKGRPYQVVIPGSGEK